MKIELEFVASALYSMLDQHNVASDGAIPLEAVEKHWAVMKLRSTDLGAGLAELCAQRRIALQPRDDGYWVRRRGQNIAKHSTRERLLKIASGFIARLALVRIRQRQGDGYSGKNRRLQGSAL